MMYYVSRYISNVSTQEKHHRRIPVTENYTLTGLYPNTLYYVWLAARSQRGEGATTIPYPVRTKQYGKQNANECKNENEWVHAARSARYACRYVIVARPRDDRPLDIPWWRSSRTRVLWARAQLRIAMAQQVGGAVALDAPASSVSYRRTTPWKEPLKKRNDFFVFEDAFSREIKRKKERNKKGKDER